CLLFFFSSRRRHTRFSRDWSSDVCSSDLAVVDTGIQPDHEFLAKNIYVPGHKASKTHFGVDFSTGKMTYTPEDQHGHGTHVAGKIGRASCRERVEISEDAGSLKREGDRDD